MKRILLVLLALLMIMGCTTVSHIEAAHTGEDIILIEMTEEKEPNWFISFLVGVCVGYGIYWGLDNMSLNNMNLNNIGLK